MEPPSRPYPPALLWVDEENKVVSFHEEAGFHVLSFPTRDAMFHFVFEKGADGFRIQ